MEFSGCRVRAPAARSGSLLFQKNFNFSYFMCVRYLCMSSFCSSMYSIVVSFTVSVAFEFLFFLLFSL